MMKCDDFCTRLIDIATNYKTLYVMGCFGAPLTDKNKARYSNNNNYNRKATRQAMIMNATSDTFGFDCVCTIKGVLWGWCGDTSKTYGGAKYKSNDVPDHGADKVITECNNVSTDFTNIQKGEAVWMSGHIGVYVGDGRVVECSPKWENKVQITNLGNLPNYNKGHARKWTKHGFLPWIDYEPISTSSSSSDSKTETNNIVKPIVKGTNSIGKTKDKNHTMVDLQP